MQAEALQRAGRDAAVGAGAAQWFTPSPRPVHPCSVVHPLPSLMLLSEQLQQLSDALSRPIRRLSTAAKVAMQVAALAVAPRLGGHHGLVGLHLSRLRAALRTREQRRGSSDATERGRALSAREAVPCRHSRRVLPSSRRWLRAHRVRAAAPVCQLGQNGCLG